MNAAIFAASLIPFSASTPLDTSTPQGRTPRMAVATFSGVSIDQLLPRDQQRVNDAGDASAAPKKLRIDVAKLSTMSGPQFEMLERFLRMIQVQRQDFNGRLLTIRRDDHQALAAILGTGVDGAGNRLDDLGLSYRHPVG